MYREGDSEKPLWRCSQVLCDNLTADKIDTDWRQDWRGLEQKRVCIMYPHIKFLWNSFCRLGLCEDNRDKVFRQYFITFHILFCFMLFYNA